MTMSNDPRIIREGGYQGTRDPGPPPAQMFQTQIVPASPAVPLGFDGYPISVQQELDAHDHALRHSIVPWRYWLARLTPIRVRIYDRERYTAAKATYYKWLRANPSR